MTSTIRTYLRNNVFNRKGGYRCCINPYGRLDYYDIHHKCLGDTSNTTTDMYFDQLGNLIKIQFPIIKGNPRKIKQMNEKKRNNETYGQTAEYALCKHYNLRCNISDDRIDTILYDKIIKQLEIEPLNGPRPIESVGFKNGAVDFICEGNMTLSLKTLKKYDGKICPQNIGQSTLKSWDKRMGTSFNGELSKNNERLEIIKNDLNSHISRYAKNIFCCDRLLLISNCEKTPKIEYLPKIDPDYFNDKVLNLTRPVYEERWDIKRQKYNEYSSQVTMIWNKKNIVIGEFQFHKSSRKEIKFRFYKTFLHRLK